MGAPTVLYLVSGTRSYGRTYNKVYQHDPLDTKRFPWHTRMKAALDAGFLTITRFTPEGP